MRKKSVLLFDSAPEFGAMLTVALGRYEVEQVRTLPQALAALRHLRHDAFLVDVTGAAVDDGMVFLKELRASGDSRLAVALSGCLTRDMPARCYEAGAGGYVAKTSLVVRELRALLPRLLGHARPTLSRLRRRDDGIPLPQAAFPFADALIDPAEMKAKFPHTAVDLNPKEVGILHLFSQRRGRLVRRMEILAHVWGPDAVPTSKSLDTYMTRLRRAFERGGSDLTSWVSAKPKVGWRIREERP